MIYGKGKRKQQRLLSSSRPDPVCLKESLHLKLESLSCPLTKSTNLQEADGSPCSQLSLCTLCCYSPLPRLEFSFFSHPPGIRPFSILTPGYQSFLTARVKKSDQHLCLLPLPSPAIVTDLSHMGFWPVSLSSCLHSPNSWVPPRPAGLHLIPGQGG
jgi:hypothetical protein